MNIFATMVHSVYDFKGYQGFVKNSWPKVLLYGLILAILSIILTFVLPMTAVLTPLGGLDNIMEEELPDFTFRNGELWVEKPVEFKQYDRLQGGIYLNINTKQPLTEEISDVDLLAYDRVLVLDAENALIKNGKDVIRISYGDIKLGDLDKDMVVREILPYIQIGMWAALILIGWFSLVGFFLGALFMAAVGSLMSSILRIRMPFGSLFKLAVYSRTAPVLLSILYTWIPVTIPFFSVINFGLSAFYLWKGIQAVGQEPFEEQAI